MLNYQSITNYLVFWLLNLVVQAIQMVSRINRLSIAIEDGDTSEIIYMYALFVRIYFFYEYDAEN